MLLDVLSLNSLLKKSLLDSPPRVEVVFLGVVQIQDLSPKTLNPIDHDLFHPEAVHHHLKSQSLHLHQSWVLPTPMDTKLFAITQTGLSIDQRRVNFCPKILIPIYVLMLFLRLAGSRYLKTLSYKNEKSYYIKIIRNIKKWNNSNIFIN